MGILSSTVIKIRARIFEREFQDIARKLEDCHSLLSETEALKEGYKGLAQSYKNLSEQLLALNTRVLALNSDIVASNGKIIDKILEGVNKSNFTITSSCPKEREEHSVEEFDCLTEAELETAIETDNFVRTQLELTEEDCDAEPDIITDDDLAELETEWQKQEAERIGNVH